MHGPVKLWRNQKRISALVGKTGKIIAYTMIQVTPDPFVGPYGVVLVEIGNERYMGQLVDSTPKSIKIGQRVTTVIRRLYEPQPDEVVPYGIKFKVI